jgi:hypothetical protein
MDFSGKLNEVEVKEATRFIRPKGYQTRMALTYARLVIYAGVVFYVLFESFARHRHIPESVIVTRIVLLVLLLGFFYFRYRKGSRQAVANLDASLPDTLSLSAEGVRLNGPNGAQGFQPWVSYKGYREGKHVVVMDRMEKGLYNVLPISGLQEGDRQNLHGLLQNYLPTQSAR